MVLIQSNYAYSDTISYETVRSILPQNAIYKVDNDFYFSSKIDLKDGWKTYWKILVMQDYPLKLTGAKTLKG